jgi:hypothetical protein
VSPFWRERTTALSAAMFFFVCLQRKLNTNACRSAESDSGITLKMGRVMPVLLCESVGSAEVGMCLEWVGKRKLTNM